MQLGTTRRNLEAIAMGRNYRSGEVVAVNDPVRCVHGHVAASVAKQLLATFGWTKIGSIVRVRIDLNEFLAVDTINAIVATRHAAPLDTII
jgi:hypothetical protein